MLTPRQKQLLEFIAKYIIDNGGMAPTFEDMLVATGLKSKSNIHNLLASLEKRGFIQRIPNIARAIKVVRTAKDTGGVPKGIDGAIWHLNRAAESLTGLGGFGVFMAAGRITSAAEHLRAEKEKKHG